MPKLLRALTYSLASALAASCAAEHAQRPASVAPPPRAELTYDELVAAAQSYLETGKPDRAIAVAEDAAAKQPERPAAYLVWARALALTNQLDDAAAKYEEARRRGERGRDLHAELASVYDVAGRYGEAIAVYRDYLSAHPDDAELHQELGLTLLLARQPSEAVAALRRAIELAPRNLQVRQDLGYALLQAGDAKAAAIELRAVVAADGARSEAWRFLAQALAAAKDMTAALEAATRAVETSQPATEALQLRARLRAELGDDRGALADWRALLAASPKDPGVMLGAAGALIALGQLDDAAALVDGAAASAGDHPWVKLRRAQLAWRRGDEKSVAQLEALADSYPTSLEVWRELHTAAQKTSNAKLRKKAAAHLTELGFAPR